MIIKVFTTPVCPYCNTLKLFLKGKGFEFEEIDISQDEKSRDEIIDKTGQMGVPVIKIEEEYIAGFDREKICNLLNIKD